MNPIVATAFRNHLGTHKALAHRSRIAARVQCANSPTASFFEQVPGAADVL